MTSLHLPTEHEVLASHLSYQVTVKRREALYLRLWSLAQSFHNRVRRWNGGTSVSGSPAFTLVA
jgi:hypothetical protein